MSKKTIGIICGVVIAVCLIFFVVPFSFTEPYEDIETYYVNEPYDATETYYVTEPYIDYVALQYWGFGSGASNYPLFWTGCDVWVTVKNTDDASGYFWVTFTITTLGGGTESKRDTHFLTSGEEHKFEVSFPDYFASYSYTVEPPTKEVTKYRDVAKQRTVTKYHDVAKQRTVTKYRTVHESLFEHLFLR